MTAIQPPPADARARALWMQQAAGWIVFRDVRQRALSRIAPSLPDAAQAAARQAVDNTVYALMQCMDGVSGQLDGPHFSLELHTSITLLDEDGNVAQALDLRDGDGMCMGFHGWVADDFGADLLPSGPDPRSRLPKGRVTQVINHRQYEPTTAIFMAAIPSYSLIIIQAT